MPAYAGMAALARVPLPEGSVNVQLNGGVAWGLNEDLAGGRVGVRVGW
ncbi:MAG TPA: hypothetical protein VFQ29_03235 [Methyloceanibacter sp.]|nr:hypothetical protein [Methyloceanibacter sp.]